MREDNRRLKIFGKIVDKKGAEKEYLLNMEQDVEKPFRYEWVEGWSQLLGSMVADLGVVMFISATVKNNVLALLFSLACVYGPMMIAEYLPYELQKALDLLPLVGSSADIFRTNTFNIFGYFVWSPYLLVTVPVLIGICCMPFAIRNWSRRLKA